MLERAADILNPWHLNTLQWMVGFVLIRVGIVFWDSIVDGIVRVMNFPKLPTRTSGKPVRYVGLDVTSVVFLAINSLNEFVFVLNLCHFIWFSPDVPKDLKDLSVVNTAVALWFTFLVMDLFYAPAHRFLHWRVVYPYIHKHHHRQIFPVRGYLDAGNEHPVEHFIGTSCTWIAVLASVKVMGAHALTIFFFFNIHAALAMLNHSPFDVEFKLLGFTYSVKAHEMHHRQFTTNYAQYFMFWDLAMGTFTEYHAGVHEQKSPRDLQDQQVDSAKTKAS